MDVVPSPSKELKKLTREKAEGYLGHLLDEWMMELRTDGEIEDKRKAVALLLDWVGWKEPPPKDPMANLPVANITIDLGDDTPRSLQVSFNAMPTPAMQAAIDVNADILDAD